MYFLRWLVLLHSVFCLYFICSAEVEVSICRFKDDKAAAVSLTFDDGLLDHATVVQPMLEKAGIFGTFFIVPKYADLALVHREDPSKRQYLTWEQIKSIGEDGHELANHSMTHANLREASDELLKREVVDTMDVIESKTGQRPETFCFAGNSRDQRALDFVVQHHVNARTYQYGIGRRFEIERFNTWLNGQIKQNKWGVLMIHAIIDDFNGYDPLPNEAADFEELLDSLNASRDDLWIGTFAEVSKYVKLREHTKVELLKNGKQFILRSDLDPAIYDIPLTVEVTHGDDVTYHSVPVNQVLNIP